MILLICARGNTRSQTACAILRDCYGVKDVIATGLETTNEETMRHLAGMTHTVIVVADVELAKKFNVAYPDIRFYHFDVGIDIWRTPMHPELVDKIIGLLRADGWGDTSPTYGTVKNYVNANRAVWANHHQ